MQVAEIHFMCRIAGLSSMWQHEMCGGAGTLPSRAPLGTVRQLPVGRDSKSKQDHVVNIWSPIWPNSVSCHKQLQYI